VEWVRVKPGQPDQQVELVLKVIKETSDQLDLLVVQVELVEWVRVKPGQPDQLVELELKEM
jgi:hypothetical protein